ncbi:MAG: hypothetical protein ACI3U0_00505 [Oscillospiraceae bacterium]
MVQFQKDAALGGVPFGVLEVTYPERALWHTEDFHSMVEEHLRLLREKYANYDRKALFIENVYFRFFKKFKKTYPVMMQLESFLLKGRPFPMENPVTAIPFLVELETQILSGTHDVDFVRGAVRLFAGTEKAPFPGMRGEEAHTYPGDFCARDDEGIIFSMIAGADARTCAKPGSRHVFYPVFGVAGQPAGEIAAVLDRLEEYVRVLAPEADISRQLL